MLACMAKHTSAAAIAENETLTPLEFHALARAAKKAPDVREFLEVGDGQEVDFKIRVRGTINVAAGQTVMVPVKPTADEILPIVLASLGPANRQRVFDALVDIYPRREAVNLPLEAEHLAKTALGLLTRQREQPRNGNVTGTIVIEPLSQRGR
jgi:hypothetical protein